MDEKQKRKALMVTIFLWVMSFLFALSASLIPGGVLGFLVLGLSAISLLCFVGAILLTVSLVIEYLDS